MNKAALPLSFRCSLDWEKMTIADKGRFCADCKKVVHDVSAMTKSEAKALLADGKKSELCIRYIADRDGQVIFKNSNLVPSNSLLRGRSPLLIAASLAIPFGLTNCAAGTDGSEESNGALQQHTQQADAGSQQEYMGVMEEREDAGEQSGDADVDAGRDEDADVDAGPAEDADTDEDAGSVIDAGPGPITK